MLLLENFFSPRYPSSWLKFGFMVNLGLATTIATPFLAAARESVKITSPQPQMEAFAQASVPNATISDGVYLYGQSPQPEQLGKEYLVFQVKKGKVIGAFYLPQSEFNCFFGNFNSGQMKLSILDPYERTLSPYSLALQPLSPVASNPQNTPTEMGLAGFHAIATISDNDRRILDICLNQKFK